MASEPQVIDIVVVETGERYTTVTVRPTDEARKAHKGWLLRTRTAYGRRTGNHLREVVR